MSASAPDAGDPASPCILVCALDADDVCLGCGRTIDEIGEWTDADAAEKRAILTRAAARLPAALDLSRKETDASPSHG